MAQSDGMFECVVETEVLTVKTMRPLYDQILGTEQLRLAEAIRLTRSKILLCLTDALRIWVPAAMKKE